MNIEEILMIAFVLFIGSTLQSTVGFGYSLFGIPSLVWIGIPLPETLVIVATSSFIQTLIGIKHLYNHIPWKITTIAIIIRLTTTIIGILVLVKISRLNSNEIKLIVGCTLLFVVLLQMLWKPKPTKYVRPIWGFLAFSSSGFLTGTVGLGGVPLILWTISHKWTSKKIRAFLFGLFTFSAPLNILVLYIAFGERILSGIIIGVVLSISIFLGTYIGLPIGDRLSHSILQQIAYLLLIIIAIGSIIPQMVSYL
jgi:hypothetical protein